MSTQICQCRLAADEVYFGGFHHRVTTASYWFTRYLREWQEEHGRDQQISEEVRANFNRRAARMAGTRVVIGRCSDYRRDCERRIHEKKLQEMRSQGRGEDAF